MHEGILDRDLQKIVFMPVLFLPFIIGWSVSQRSTTASIGLMARSMIRCEQNSRITQVKYGHWLSRHLNNFRKTYSTCDYGQTRIYRTHINELVCISNSCKIPLNIFLIYQISYIYKFFVMPFRFDIFEFDCMLLLSKFPLFPLQQDRRILWS